MANSLLKFILYPFGFIYRMAIAIRNFLYDKKIFKSTQFSIPVIGVGNLAAGGTGKTPMVEYLLRLFKGTYNIATISRGYGRKTRGFRIANDEDTSATIGDEPLQLYNKFKPEVIVAVGEERILAVPQILYTHPEIQLILLDDAFQHRAIRPNLQIMLTQYRVPFYYDTILPAGRLREPASGSKRADIIVVTKCPESITNSEMERMTLKIKSIAGAKPVFFTTQLYDQPYKINGEISNEPLRDVVLISGVANGYQLKEELSKKYTIKKHYQFTDHHNYSRSEIVKINKKTGSRFPRAAIVTTEKDAVKLKAYADLFDTDLYVIPLRIGFIKDAEKFAALIREAAVYRED